MPPRVAVVDSGPLYAAADEDDPNHNQSLAVLSARDFRFVIPALVVAEVTYMIGDRLGPKADARFLRSLLDEEVRAPEPEDWPLIGQLVEKYADFPLGGTDASIVVLADRLRTRLIVTTDRRHFGVLRNGAGQPFELLPEL